MKVSNSFTWRVKIRDVNSPRNPWSSGGKDENFHFAVWRSENFFWLSDFSAKIFIISAKQSENRLFSLRCFSPSFVYFFRFVSPSFIRRDSPSFDKFIFAKQNELLRKFFYLLLQIKKGIQTKIKLSFLRLFCFS